MTIFDVEIGALQGGSAQLDRLSGHSVLVVNVASRCGLTPEVADGVVLGRFEPQTDPQDPELVRMVEKSLPH